MLSNPKIELGWMTIENLSELTGLTTEAIRAYKKKGKIRMDYHWRKHEGRILIHYGRFQEWMSGKSPRTIRA